MIGRYTKPEMQKIWSEEEKFKTWLTVEIAVLEAQAENGEIPRDVVAEVKKKAKIDVARIQEIEKDLKHDLISFLKSLEEFIGPASRYIHHGLTSYDVVDTALSLRMKEAGKIILNELNSLKDILKRKAVEEKYTPMVGRTHGIHAEPITLGLKFLVWYKELERNIKRWEQALENISYGKISGSCGNYSYIDPALEENVCKRLGLKPAPVSTQIIQRDRHAEYLSVLALIAATCEKIALEIRHLSRTEVHEFEEPFARKQMGSSIMPHKKNPEISERICGLARVVRSNLIAALENIALWHERDISHSSVERIIIPDSTTLVHYILKRIQEIVDNLVIVRENISENISKTRGLIFSARVLFELIKKGLTRHEAYKIVQKNAMKVDKKTGLKELLAGDEDVKKYLSKEELDDCFKLDYYYRNVDKIYKRAIE